MTETKKVYKMIEPYLTKEVLGGVALLVAAVCVILILRKTKGKGSNYSIFR